MARIGIWSLVLGFCSLAASAGEPVPQWLWYGKVPDGVCHFRAEFDAQPGVTQALLQASADNHFTLFLNGEKVAAGDEWTQPAYERVTDRLKPGRNVIAVQARNDSGGAAGFVAQLTLTGKDRPPRKIVSDGTWRAAEAVPDGWQKPEFDAAAWSAPKVLGPLGREPWGNLFATGPKGRTATPAESLKVLDGFKVELLRTAEPGEGSWVSMAVDPRGRLYISPQGGEPILRVTFDGQGQIAKLDPVQIPVKAAMGLLWANDGLYVNGGGPDGYCLYRATDTDGNDALDKAVLIHKTEGGGGEHGTHGVLMGRDGKLYVVCGNFVRPPAESPDSPHKNFADDLALPRAEDGNGFGAGERPPGGYVMRMDPDGSNCVLFAAGQRNTYDIAFNADGELFGFDSDMEWDWALPWYRPTRIFHIVSGADHGYRGGSGKWPEWYEDSLPATVNIGIGSPTGVRFGTGAKFPAKYQRALYAMDWSYGRLLAVHLKPEGASYTATFENLVAGRPLNLTDFEIGADGALYFITGGRGTLSGLYRVTYTGREATAAVDGHDTAGAADRAKRRELEAFHGRPNPKAVEAAWSSLDSPDRYLRYAARIAIEAQPVAQWKDRALAETKTEAGLTALLALARLGGKVTQDALFDALKKFPMTKLTEAQQLVKLRIIEVSLARNGRPSAEWTQRAAEKLLPLYPAKSDALNRELAQVLLALEVPGAVQKTLELARGAKTLEQQTAMMFALRTVTNGWTREDRVAWFGWFNPGVTSRVSIARQSAFDPQLAQWFEDVDSNVRTGSSYAGFIRGMRRAGVAALSDAERFELAALLTQPLGPSAPSAKKPLNFVKAWQPSDFGPELDAPSKKSNLKKGREAYETSLCIMCHRFGDEGGAVGPDLTAVASRFSRRDLLDNILDPSKVVSEQFAVTVVTKKDGSQVAGRILSEDDQRIVLLPNPLAPDDTVEAKKAEITARAFSPHSSMPPGLLNLLTKEEVLDLLAYLESGVKKQR